MTVEHIKGFLWQSITISVRTNFAYKYLFFKYCCPTFTKCGYTQEVLFSSHDEWVRVMVAEIQRGSGSLKQYKKEQLTLFRWQVNCHFDSLCCVWAVDASVLQED